MIKLIVIAILGAPLVICALSPLYLKWGVGKWFYHNVLGWHMPKENEKNSFDGCSEHNHCKYCDKDIMQDSQGNWF